MTLSGRCAWTTPLNIGSVAALGFGLLVGGPPSGADTPSPAMVVILTAIDKAEAASSERSTLTLVTADQTTRIVMERHAPDRRHVITETGGRRMETIVVGNTLYRRSGGSWSREHFYPLRSPAPSMREFLAGGVTDLRELPTVPPGGSALRRFVGRLAWPTNSVTNSGELELTISASTGLPQTVVVKGTCVGQVCRFEQAFEFDGTVSIEAPTP